MKRKLFLLLPAFFLFSFTAVHASAQVADAGNGVTATSGKAAKKSKASGVKKTSGRADAELDELSTNLSLTDDQKSKIKPIIDDKTAKIHVVKQAKTGADDDKKAKTKEIRTVANAQIRALLTPEQQSKFDASSKKGGKGDKGGKKGKKGAESTT